MDEILASMWNSLSLIENEAVTLFFDETKLTGLKFAILGKLAMKKNVSTMDVDKFLKFIWKTTNSMETTLVGENIYLFSFRDQATRNRISIRNLGTSEVRSY